MTNPFEQAAAQTSCAIDAVFGEAFTFVAMAVSTDVDAPRGPDATRPNFDCVGAYVGPSRSLYPRAPGPAPDNQAQGTVASHPLVSIDNSALAWTPTTNDRVIRQKTGETFEISKPMPDGVRRTIFHLTARKRV